MALQTPMPDPTSAGGVMPLSYTRIVFFSVSLTAQVLTFTTRTWRDRASCEVGAKHICTNSYRVEAKKGKTPDGDDIPSWAECQAACQQAYAQVQTYLYGLLKSMKVWKGALDV